MTDSSTVTEKTHPRPQMSDICAGCKHEFSKHYTSYDNERIGCSHKSGVGSGNIMYCACNGFTFFYKWEHDINIIDYYQLEDKMEGKNKV